MTQKHFRALAAALARTRPARTSEHFNIWWQTAQSIATACHESNPRFNRTRFLDAATQ